MCLHIHMYIHIYVYMCGPHLCSCQLSLKGTNTVILIIIHTYITIYNKVFRIFPCPSLMSAIISSTSSLLLSLVNPFICQSLFRILSYLFICVFFLIFFLLLLCGQTGYIKTSFGSLLIQPVNQTGDGDSEVLHKVWRHSRRNARHAVADSFDMDLKELEERLFTRLHRKKRNYVDRHVFTMEVLVAVDKTMSEFHGSDLKSYILTLISIVSNIYADASIGNSIYITVANILILRDDRRKGEYSYEFLCECVCVCMAEKGWIYGGVWIYSFLFLATSASAMLKDFCGVVSKQGYHYDTAMLITRWDWDNEIFTSTYDKLTAHILTSDQISLGLIQWISRSNMYFLICGSVILLISFWFCFKMFLGVFSIETAKKDSCNHLCKWRYQNNN